LVNLSFGFLSSQRDLDDINAFFEGKNTVKYKLTLEQAKDSILAAVGWLERDREDVTMVSGTKIYGICADKMLECSGSERTSSLPQTSEADAKAYGRLLDSRLIGRCRGEQLGCFGINNCSILRQLAVHETTNEFVLVPETRDF
jgi:hypothetical protein